MAHSDILDGNTTVIAAFSVSSAEKDTLIMIKEVAILDPETKEISSLFCKDYGPISPASSWPYVFGSGKEVVSLFIQEKAKNKTIVLDRDQALIAYDVILGPKLLVSFNYAREPQTTLPDRCSNHHSSTGHCATAHVQELYKQFQKEQTTLQQQPARMNIMHGLFDIDRKEINHLLPKIK